MTPRLLLLAALVFSAAAISRAAEQPCDELARAAKTTYDFKPSRLKDEAESNAKSAAMDGFWNLVKARQKELLPCLRAAVEDPQSDPWFRFDGSNLLVHLDPSPESKAAQVRRYAEVDLGDADLRDWVSTLARRGAEGFDVSGAGARWLALPQPGYYLPEHGAQKVDKFLGAIFIYGAMDEAQATPALLKSAGDRAMTDRGIAVSLLLMQATPDAMRGLRESVLPSLPADMQAMLRRQLESPKVIVPREKPKTGRGQFLKAFAAASAGDWGPFLALVSEVPDGERDVVATLKAEDLPLLRRVRRSMIAKANPHAAEYYVTFTQILTTLTLKAEAKR